MRLMDKPSGNMELIETPPDYILARISNGDFDDNASIDECCARRLLILCDDYGDDGREAKELLRLALRKIEVYA